MSYFEYDPGIWWRCSRGHGIDFYSSNEELTGFFRDLPWDTDLYLFRMARWKSVDGYYEKSKSSRKSTLVSCEMSVQEWVECVARGDVPASNSFLHPTFLCARPSDNNNKGTSVEKWCSINGMIELQAIDPPGGRLGQRSIGIVSLIENRLTGERHRHERQLELFKSLKKRIRRKLTHASRPIFMDGSIGEEDRSVRMTDAAVELARAGRVAAVPGRRLKKSR